MAYIDLDEINRLHPKLTVKYPLSFANGISAAISEINKLPNADVVPKSEVEIWKQERFNLFQRIKLYEMTRQKVAREIFAEIEMIMLDGEIGGKYAAKVINPDKYAELKKKYTE